MQENIRSAIRLITEKVLTPVLYMLEHDDRIDFICFCDKSVKLEELYDVSAKLTEMLGTPAEIIDIREFSEVDRLEVLKTAELIHSEHPLIEQVFIASMTQDFQLAVRKKTDMIDRNQKTGTYFVQ